MLLFWRIFPICWFYTINVIIPWPPRSYLPMLILYPLVLYGKSESLELLNISRVLDNFIIGNHQILVAIFRCFIIFFRGLMDGHVILFWLVLLSKFFLFFKDFGEKFARGIWLDCSIYSLQWYFYLLFFWGRLFVSELRSISIQIFFDWIPLFFLCRVSIPL